MKATNITQCKECGSKDISWFTTNTTLTGIQQGRLKTSEVTCRFVLGCDQCSETLKVVTADAIAAILNASAEPVDPECDYCAGAGHDYYGEKCVHCKPSAPVVRIEDVTFIGERKP